MQSMSKDFTFKTNLIKMDFKPKRIKSRFIHIPNSLFVDLDKKFKGKQMINVSISHKHTSIIFLGKISRIDNKTRKTKTYYIRIPREYYQLLDDDMFNRESITCDLTPIENQ